MLFEKQIKLIPVIVSSGDVLRIFKRVHGYPTGFISTDDLSYEKSIGHVLAIVFDRVREIQSLHPFDHFAR
jgi:hypothetical protein